MMHNKLAPLILSGLMLCLLSGCESGSAIAPKAKAEVQKFGGETMGTSFSILYVAPPDGKIAHEDLSKAVLDQLQTVNEQMSNWLADSEISLFNKSESLDWFPVSKETALVLNTAREISEKTDGAFDVTVAPLIDLWGFGPTGRDQPAPTEAQLQAVAGQIGWNKIEVRLDPSALKKTSEKLSANLSAIAKGYGVDAVAQLLEQHKITAYLVEIGGEIRVKGIKPDGKKWKVAIERPEPADRQYQQILPLTDIAMATSGDYRNYREANGKRFSHTIDPRTLKPSEHSLAAVTVLAESCMEADALATALMVMGPETGYNYAEEHKLPVLMLIHSGDEIEEKPTSHWTARVGEEQ